MRHFPEPEFRPASPVAAAFGQDQFPSLWQPMAPQRGFDFRALWGVAYRNWKLIGAVVMLGSAAGVGAALLTAPSYKARSSLQVDQQTARVLGTEDVEPAPSAQEADRFLQTQVDILKSRALSESVVRKLKLDSNKDFLTDIRPSSADRADRTRLTEVAIEGLQENLSVSLPRNSRIVTIGVYSHNPRLAARIANTVSETFIQTNLERRFDTSSYSRAFLQKQLAATKDKLEASERELNDYARAAQLIDASEGIAAGGAAGPQSLTTSNLVRINAAYADAQANRIAAQQRWQAAQGTGVMNLPEVQTNMAIQQLVRERAAAEAEYREELLRHKENYPTVQKMREGMDALDRRIGAFAGNIRNSLRDAYVVAQRQEAALSGSVGALKGATMAERDRSVRYNILRREVDTNRELYDGLLQRYKQVSAQAGAADNNITVIDRAVTPLKPVSPDLPMYGALGLLAGLVVAAGAVLVREKVGESFRSPDDIEAKLGLPLLGVVPSHMGKEQIQIALTDPKSPLSEAYHSIRAAIELSSATGLPRSLLFTSTGQGEGKSTTAFAFARNLAATGMKVLMIDADLRRPSLHRLAMVPNANGLSQVLARQKALGEVVQQSTLYGNLHVIASGPLPPNPAELFVDTALADILTRCKDHYDMVVIDGPPVMGLADSPRLARLAEATVFVVQANATHCGNARTALRRLHDARARMLGAVLTRFDAKQVGYSTDYTYGYSYTYGADAKAEKAREDEVEVA